MKIIYKIVLIAWFGLFLHSCGDSALVLGKVEKCYFPDNSQEKAPLWVCGADFRDYPVYSVGSSKIVNNNYEFAKTEAKVYAMGKIADSFATSVNKKVALNESNNSNTVNNNNNSLYVKNIRSSVQTITTQEIIGISILRTIQSKKGVLYVMVGLSKDKYNLNIALFAEKLNKKYPSLEVQKIKSLMLDN